jgi:hypothetical protein
MAKNPGQGLAKAANQFNQLYQSQIAKQGGKAKGIGGGEGKKKRRRRKQPPAAPPKKKAGGGGGGGKGGQAAKATNRLDALGPNNALDNQVQEHVQGILSGEKSRWSEDRMNMAKDSLFESTVGQTEAQLKGMNKSLARRGLLRTGIAAKAEKDLRSEGMKAYSQGVRELIMKKMDDEFNDKMKAMDTGINWLNSARNFELGRERNVIAREQIAATLQAAAMQAEVAREGIKAANGRAAAALGFQRQQAAEANARYVLSQAQIGSGGQGGFAYDSAFRI